MMIHPIMLSLRVASIATVFAFILGTFLAFLMIKKKIPGKNIWETLIILPMVLPPSVVGYILLVIFGKRGFVGAFLLKNFDFQIVFTWVACVIAACVVALPLMYQSVKGGLLSVDTIYEEAAATLGSGKLKIFCQITLPLAWPGIISGIVLTFARAMGEFGATLMLAGNIPGRTQTVPTAIYFAVDSGKDQLANTLVLIMTIFSFAVVFGLNFWLKKKGYR